MKNIAIGALVALAFSFLAGSSGIFSSHEAAIMGLVAAIFVVTIMHNLSGNKHVTRADSAQTAAAKEMAPGPDQSAIYIVRKGFVGTMQGMDVSIGDVGNTQIKGGLFTMAFVSPGLHSVSAEAAQNSGGATILDVDAKAGDVIVITASLSMGMLRNSVALTMIDDEGKARSLVKGAKLVTLEPLAPAYRA